MVALPTSSASRTGGAQEALQQEQRAESATVHALPHPRPASTSPPQIKDEVGVPSGSTTSIDEGVFFSSVHGVGRVADASADAFEQDQRVAECELLLLWLHSRRLDSTVAETEADWQSRRVLDDYFRSAWHRTDWVRAGSIEIGYMRSLESYQHRLEEIKFRGRSHRDFTARFRHLDQELKSVDRIKASILLGDRRSELELAKQLTDQQIAFKDKTDQENLCRTCPPTLRPQGTSAGERAGIGEGRIAAAYSVQVPSLRLMQDIASASRLGQAAVSQAASNLRDASLASLKAEVASRQRSYRCVACICSTFDSILSRLELLKESLLEASAASPSSARSERNEITDAPSNIVSSSPATATGNALSHADSTVCSKLGFMAQDAVLAHSHRHPGDTTARAACSDEVTVSVGREAHVGDSSKQSELSPDEVVNLGQPCVILASIYGVSSGGARHGVVSSLPRPDLIFGDFLPGDIVTCTTTNIISAPIEQAIRTRFSPSSASDSSPDSTAISFSACAEQSLAASAAGIGPKTITFGTLAKPSLGPFPAPIAREVGSPLRQPQSHNSRAFQFSERSLAKKQAGTIIFEAIAISTFYAAMRLSPPLLVPPVSVLGHDLAVLRPTGPGPPCMPANAHGELPPSSPRQSSGFACIQGQDPAMNSSCPRSETRRGTNAISQAPHAFSFQDSRVCVAATLRGIRISEMSSVSQQSRIDSVHHPCVGVPDISVVMHICIDGFQAESAVAQNAETISPITNFTTHQWSSGDGDHSQTVARSPSYVVGNMHEQQAHQRAGDGVAQRAAVAVCKSPLSSSTRMEVEVARCISQTLPVEAPPHPVSLSPISSIGGGSAQQDGGVCHRYVSPLAPHCQCSVTDSCLLLLGTVGLPFFESSLSPLQARRNAARCEVAQVLVGMMQMRREQEGRACVRTSQERSVPEGVVLQKSMHEGAEGAIQEGVARPAALDGARQRQVPATAAPVSAGILSAGGVHSLHVAAHRTQTPTLVPPSRLGDSLSRSLQDYDPTQRRSDQEGVIPKSMRQETLVWDRMVLALMKQMVAIREATKQEGVVCDLVMAWEQAAAFLEMVIGKVELDKESGNSDSASTQVATSTTVTISPVSPTASASTARPQWAFFDNISNGAAFVQCGGSDASPGYSKAHLALARVTKPNSRAELAQACAYKGATHSSAVTQQSKRNLDARVPESLRYPLRFCGPKPPVRNNDGHPSARFYLTSPSTSSYAVAPGERATGQHSTITSPRIGLPSNDAARGIGFENQIQARELKSTCSSALRDVGMCFELEVELLSQGPTDFGLLLREHVAVGGRGVDFVCENGHQTSVDFTTITHRSCADTDSRPHTDEPMLTGQPDHAHQFGPISHQWTLLVCPWVSLVKQVLLAVMNKALEIGERLDSGHAGEDTDSSRPSTIHPQCTGHCSSFSSGRQSTTTLRRRDTLHAFGHSALWGFGVIRLIWDLGYRRRRRRENGSRTGYVRTVIRMS
ncbi:hypothetical protein CF326_g3803 [Tilletia indica]|nr:hypothetical protein CF326_g3803 [Tilletia indica]